MGSLSYSEKTGLWTASVSLPPGPDGKRRRKVARSKSKEAATKKLREMNRELNVSGDLVTASPTLASWLETWLVDYSAPRVRPSTQKNRVSDVRLHITPVIGRKRLDKLTATDVKAMHRAITEKGNSSTTALRCHRLLSVALRDAMRAGKVNKNVATRDHVDAPRAAVKEPTLLTPEQTVTLLETASQDRHLAARWATSVLTGTRRGEVLGLEWDRVHFDDGDARLVLSWQLQRLPWTHGCTKGINPTCGRKRAADCPKAYFAEPDGFEKRQVHHGLYLIRPKTRKSWRVVPLVDPLLSYLRVHHDNAGRPTEGLVFTEPNGQPIDPRDDGARWKELLERAGLPHVRGHDARHGAATLMLRNGVDPRVVQEILGHNSVAMTQHYQHADRTLTRDAMARLAAALPGLLPAN